MSDRNRKSESGSKQGVASSIPERRGMDPYKKNLGLGEERAVGMAKSLRERDTTSSSCKKDPATIRSPYKTGVKINRLPQSNFVEYGLEFEIDEERPQCVIPSRG